MTPYWDNGTVQLHKADARALPIADESVHCVVTSPPYWGLRDYGNGDDGIGLEETPEAWVENLVAVFREVRRVLRPDGTVWLNLGDAYAGGTPGQDGRKPKDLIGLPWRVAFALQADGWWLRSDIVWSKPNPMPESVTDRPTRAHEYLFLLTKSARYYYDADAIKEPGGSVSGGRQRSARVGDFRYADSVHAHNITGTGGNSGINKSAWSESRNKRTVWTIATHPYPEAHFATFPEKLVEPCVLAATSDRGVCAGCGAPWVRRVDLVGGRTSGRTPERQAAAERAGKPGGASFGSGLAQKDISSHVTTGWDPPCECNRPDTVPATVLDPFGGSGTVGAVAQRLGRRAVLTDLNADYLKLAQKRIERVPLAMHMQPEAAAKGAP